jgi:hypothetical protein
MKTMFVTVLLLFYNTDYEVNHSPDRKLYNVDFKGRYGPVDLRYERFSDGDKFLYCGYSWQNYNTFMIYSDGKISVK